jgi:hypothetical protein
MTTAAKYLTVTNPLALNAAIELVAGPQAVALVNAVFTKVDALMTEAYTAGRNDERQIADQELVAYGDKLEVAENNAFAEGWGQGYDDGVTGGYIDAYIDGVRDARVNPVKADAVIANNIMPDTNQKDMFAPGQVNVVANPNIIYLGSDIDSVEIHARLLDPTLG